MKNILLVIVVLIVTMFSTMEVAAQRSGNGNYARYTSNSYHPPHRAYKRSVRPYKRHYIKAPARYHSYHQPYYRHDNGKHKGWYKQAYRKRR